MKQLTLFIFTVLAGAIIFTNCKSDNVEDYYSGDEVCDTNLASFTNDIMPIMESKCISCHGSNSSSGLSLTNYNEIKQNIDLTIESITRTNNFMPKNGTRLPDCSINKFKAWKSQGTLNN